QMNGREAVGLMGIARDVTDRVRAEEEHAELLAREQEARLAAEASERRFAFVAQASAVLASSLDWKHPLRRIARLAVPEGASGSAVYEMGDAGEMEEIEIAHSDTPEARQMRAWMREHAIARDSTHPVAEVIRSGEPVLIAEAAPDSWPDVYRTPDAQPIPRT